MDWKSATFLRCTAALTLRAIRLRTSPMFGRTGPSGNDERRTYYEERLNVA